MTLDGVGRSIGKDFDIYSMMEDDIHELIKDGFSKDEIIEEGLWTARDLISSSRLIPRHLKWFLKDWSKKKYAFEFKLSGHEKSISDLNNSIVFLGYVLIGSVFVFSGVSFINNSQPILTLKDIPSISWIFWSLASVCFSLGHVRIKTK